MMVQLAASGHVRLSVSAFCIKTNMGDVFSANLTVTDCFKKKLHEISNIVNFPTPRFTVCPPSR